MENLECIFLNSNAQVEVTREIERDAEVLTQRMRTRTLFQLSTIMRKFGKPALFQWENPAEVEVCLRRSFAFVSSLRKESCENLSKKNQGVYSIILCQTFLFPQVQVSVDACCFCLSSAPLVPLRFLLWCWTSKHSWRTELLMQAKQRRQIAEEDGKVKQKQLELIKEAVKKVLEDLQDSSTN